MKECKKGFTMAELLLCLGIIGVISAMGIVSIRSSADSAYSLFYYNGYINLYNTIAEILSNEEDITNDQLAIYLGEGHDGVVKTKNGITYSANTNDQNETTITMTVPQRKTRNNNGTGTVSFRYYPEKGGYLIPLAVGTVNLQERRDLLPTYIDNGKDGRINRVTGHVEPIVYYNYRQAFCALINQNITDVISCNNVVGRPNNVSGVLKVANPKKAR